MASVGELWARAEPYVEKLAVWRGYEQELQTLAIFGIGIAVYTALVFAFYANISKRRPFRFRAGERRDWGGRMTRFAERALGFPILSFLYFMVLAASLFFLTKPAVATGTILLTAMAVVVGVRVTVYLSEAMSNDLSKLVPLSLLAVLLVDPSYLSLKGAWVRFAESTHLGPLLFRYFLLFIALEAVFSSGRWIVLRASGRDPAAKTRRVDVKETAKPPLQKSP